MGRRRRSEESSGAKRWLLSAVLRFFGISSPAVLLMAVLSYFGFKTPVPDGPSDSPEVIARRAKKIIETVSTAKTKLKETLSAFGKDDDAPPAKRTTADDDDLMNVTYQELFEDDKAPPVRVTQAPPATAPSKVSPNAKASERPAAKVSDRGDRKKIRSDFPDALSDSPYR